MFIADGCTTGMSQAIAIGADGEIANVLAGGGSNTMRSNKQKNNEEDEYDWWKERMARHKYFMQLLKYGEANKSLLLYGSGSFMGSFSGGSSLTGWASEYTSFQSRQASEDEIKSMLQSGLREKLGDTICGMPTEQVIEQTWSDIDNCRSIRNSLMMM